MWTYIDINNTIFYDENKFMKKLDRKEIKRMNDELP